ncbi:MAG: hypothetical protein ACLTLQ_09080 [[Clostridium] scindens]
MKCFIEKNVGGRTENNQKKSQEEMVKEAGGRSQNRPGTAGRRFGKIRQKKSVPKRHPKVKKPENEEEEPDEGKTKISGRNYLAKEGGDKMTVIRLRTDYRRCQWQLGNPRRGGKEPCDERG